MRYVELYETRVKSSWIMDLSKDDEENGVIMTLLSGRSYLVNNVPNIVFRRWVRAPSKGKFWHQKIRGNFWVDRLA